MASGLTSTGLVIELIDDIRTSMEADLRATFYQSLPLGDKTLLGHIVGIISNSLGLLWERLEQVYNALDPDAATGPALDAVCVLTGTFRQPATKSYTTLTLCGNTGTTIAAGAVVASSALSSLWDTRTTVTTIALTAWAASTAYIVGDRRTNSSRCYQCTVAGTSAGSGGPTSALAVIVDGGVTWTYLGEGVSAVDVVADCEVTGPTQGTAGDLNVIQTPVGGWTSARNILDATLGTNESTDEELRLLRQLELAGAGASTKDALRSAMLKVANVTSCTVFVNRSDVTDINGLPPHSFETLVRGGANQDVVDTIANNLPEGIATYSSTATSGTHTDSEGNTETIFYTRPTNENIYVLLYVNVDASLYPADGATEIKTAITTWGAGFPTDRDVDPSAVGAQSFSVLGVLGVTRCAVHTDVIGTPVAWAPTTAYVATVGAPSIVTNDGGRIYACTTGGTSAGSGGPTGTGTAITDGGAVWRFLGNIIVISARQLAVFDSTRITVVSTPVTP